MKNKESQSQQAVRYSLSPKLENNRSKLRGIKPNLGNKLFIKIIYTFLISFSLNLLWEFAHSFLYDWNKYPLNNGLSFYIARILWSTLGDAVIICGIMLAVLLVKKNYKWINNPLAKDYMVFAITGFIIALIIEYRAKMLNLWSYNKYMPLIFGFGLTPLIQLSITGAVTLYFVSKIKNPA